MKYDTEVSETFTGRDWWYPVFVVTDDEVCDEVIVMVLLALLTVEVALLTVEVALLMAVLVLLMHWEAWEYWTAVLR